MPDYQLVTVVDGKNGRAGLLIGDLVHDIAELSGRDDFATVRGIVARWKEAAPLLASLAADAPAGGRRLADCTLGPALPDPGTIVCAGANYQEHIDRMAQAIGVPSTVDRAMMGKPLVFIKASSCVVGTGIAVRLADPAMDYEAELAAVIGVETRSVAPDRALASVAGYMVANDLSARSLGARRNMPADSPMRPDVFAHKNFDGACPLGPWLVPADQVADPQDLRIRTWVNDEIRQDASTAGMMFSLAEIIAYVSGLMTLRPGDVILTGTPSGVAAETGRFLKTGDTCRIEIAGLGTLETPIAAPLSA